MTLKRNLSAVLIASFATAACLPGAAVAKEKEYKWGSIAVDLSKPDRDPGYGIGGAQTEEEAKEEAIKACKDYGNKGCKVVVTYQDCGAYAASKKGGGFGINTTKKTAEAKAMSGCDDDGCKVVVSDCN